MISSDSVGKLPVKLVAPITACQDRFSSNIWHVRIDPTPKNGLYKVSTVDTLQIRGADIERFVSRLDTVDQLVLVEISEAIAAVIEYEPTA